MFERPLPGRFRQTVTVFCQHIPFQIRKDSAPLFTFRDLAFIGTEKKENFDLFQTGPGDIAEKDPILARKRMLEHMLYVEDFLSDISPDKLPDLAQLPPEK